MALIRNLLDIDREFMTIMQAAVNTWTWEKDNWTDEAKAKFGYEEGSSPIPVKFSYQNPRFLASLSDAESNIGTITFPYLVVDALEPVYSDKKIYTDEYRQYNSELDDVNGTANSGTTADIVVYPPPVRMVFSYQVTAGVENYLDYSVISNILRDRLFPMFQGNRWITINNRRYVLSITDTNSIKESDTGRTEFKITYAFELNIYFLDIVNDFSVRDINISLEQL